MGRRIDVVLLIGDVVFASEFKVGSTHVERSAEEQVWDYALDLKNFHEASHALPIVPVAVATECAASGHSPLFTSASRWRVPSDRRRRRAGSFSRIERVFRDLEKYGELKPSRTGSYGPL